MIDHFFNKRGVSPLIMTIFLVALAVALGAMIMSWGSGSGSRSSSGCESVGFSAQVIGGSELICFNETSGMLKIVVVNSGSVGFDAIVHREVGSDFNVVDSILSRSDLGVGQVLSTELLIRPGRVRVELIPAINVLNERVLCTGKSLVREDISRC